MRNFGCINADSCCLYWFSFLELVIRLAGKSIIKITYLIQSISDGSGSEIAVMDDFCLFSDSSVNVMEVDTCWQSRRDG